MVCGWFYIVAVHTNLSRSDYTISIEAIQECKRQNVGKSIQLIEIPDQHNLLSLIKTNTLRTYVEDLHRTHTNRRVRNLSPSEPHSLSLDYPPYWDQGKKGRVIVAKGSDEWNMVAKMWAQGRLTPDKILYIDRVQIPLLFVDNGIRHREI